MSITEIEEAAVGAAAETVALRPRRFQAAAAGLIFEVGTAKSSA
jgi:hypothetical protein